VFVLCQPTFNKYNWLYAVISLSLNAFQFGVSEL